MTVRQLTSAVEMHLQQLGDDSKFTFAQLAFYVQAFANKYLYLKQSTQDSGSYLSVYPEVPVNTQTASSLVTNIVVGRKYFELPASILDIDGDTGIDYIAYYYTTDDHSPSFANLTFTRTTPSKAKRLYQSVYEKPSSSNPYFYRIGKYVYLLGVEDFPLFNVEVGLKLSFDPFDGDLDANLPIDEYAGDILKEVISLGRFGLMIPEERVNDGSGEMTGNLPTNKIVSVS